MGGGEKQNQVWLSSGHGIGGEPDIMIAFIFA